MAGLMLVTKLKLLPSGRCRDRQLQGVSAAAVLRAELVLGVCAAAWLQAATAQTSNAFCHFAENIDYASGKMCVRSASGPRVRTQQKNTRVMADGGAMPV